MQIFTFYPEDLKKLIKEAVDDGLRKFKPAIGEGEIKPRDKEIYNVIEAAAYLNMAVPTLRKKYKKHIIKFVQEGSKITFRREHLNQYLDKYTL